MKKSKPGIFTVLFLAFAFLAQQGRSEEVFPLQTWKNKDGKTIDACLLSLPSKDKLAI